MFAGFNVNKQLYCNVNKPFRSIFKPYSFIILGNHHVYIHSSCLYSFILPFIYSSFLSFINHPVYIHSSFHLFILHFIYSPFFSSFYSSFRLFIFSSFHLLILPFIYHSSFNQFILPCIHLFIFSFYSSYSFHFTYSFILDLFILCVEYR